jgi:hypothetical protein
MRNAEKIESLLKGRIEGLASEIGTQRTWFALLSALSAIPFLALGVLAVTKPDLLTGEFAALVAAVCAIGLTIVIWNIGSGARERARRGEEDRERLENLQLCLMAVPEDRIKVSDFMAILSRRENYLDSRQTIGAFEAAAQDTPAKT